MGSSWVLLCAIAARLALQGAASEERPIEQRPITDVPGQEMIYDDSFFMQRQVDMSSVFDLQKESLLQRPINPPLMPMGEGAFAFGVMTPRGSRPSFEQYPVNFPLSQPSADNIEAICRHGDFRPRYPKSYFPTSSFSKFKRMAAAVNNAESWFGTCCNQNQTSLNDTVLCCTTQAWELSVKLFCEEDSAVKDVLYECCRKRGIDRLKCFNADSLNQNYQPTEELPVSPVPPTAEFNFDPSICPRKLMTPRSVRKKEKKTFTSQKTDINFPLGQPTADNIESLCRTSRRQPFYSIRCLPRSGYELLARQAKSINSLTRAFQRCCSRSNKLNCANQKWREELEKFCSVKQKKTSFMCCSGDDPAAWSACFQSASPDPYYNTTSASKEASLTNLCDNPSLKNRLPTEFPAETFLSECCPLPEPDKTICSTQKLAEMSQEACSKRESQSVTVKLCCRLGSQERSSKCVSKLVMDPIANAARNSRKRKICPIS
ncbi:Extracellular matrix protein 1 [Oryzias melastigma]|nr:Extracellular matrix protein 1 [Oryzias melastigma]